MGRKMCLFRRKILREMQRVERGGKKRNISSFLSNIVTDDDYGVIGVSFFGGREWRGGLGGILPNCPSSDIDQQQNVEVCLWLCHVCVSLSVALVLVTFPFVFRIW